jgi:hypothetical protein
MAVIGAVLIGGTAWARMTPFVPPNLERRVAAGPASFPLARATKDGEPALHRHRRSVGYRCVEHSPA